MDYDSCRSLPAMFFEQAARLGDKPFLWAKRDGRYRSISWAAAARDVRRLALGLRSLGIGQGERVGLVGENRPEWVIADLAIMSAGAITVPAYVTHTVDDHRHVLANSGARAVIVSKPPLVRPGARRGEPGLDRAHGHHDRAGGGPGECGRRPALGGDAGARRRDRPTPPRSSSPRSSPTTPPA